MCPYVVSELINIRDFTRLSTKEYANFQYAYNIFQILRDAQTLAERMYHRGACACDNDTGDGAGVMTAIPHNLYVKEL